MKIALAAAVEQQRAEELDEPDDLELTIGSNVKMDETASAYVYHQTQPSPALLTLVMAAASQNQGEAEKSEALWDYFRGTLSPTDFRHLRNRVITTKDIDLDRLVEVFEKSSAFWSSFPTKPSSASSGSQRSIGTTSTGRAAGPGSTRFGSPSVAS